MRVISGREDWQKHIEEQFDEEERLEAEREERIELNWFRFMCFVVLVWSAFLMWVGYRFVVWLCA